MANNTPGLHRRKGISLMEFADMFPDEEAATQWFEAVLWPDGKPVCPRWKGTNTYRGTHKTMPYRCRPCRRTFSVRSSTVLAHSRISLRKWVWALYLEVTDLKGAASMKLHRDIGVRQATAWFMLQRIGEGFSQLSEAFCGASGGG